MAARIYTRTGDKGTTGLYDGSRVDKDNARIECLGELDEVNCMFGLLRSKLPADHAWQQGLQRIQISLMDSMAHVATPGNSTKTTTRPIPVDADKWLETWIDSIESSLNGRINSFLLPGGNEEAALCHMLRSLIRRAERRLITLNKTEPLAHEVMRFINRLSDLMFNLAREALDKAGLEEEKWNQLRYK